MTRDTVLALTLFACACGSSSGTSAAGSDGGAANPSIVVLHQGVEHTVAVGSLARTPIDNDSGILLSAIVQAALPTADLATLQASDFVSLDGFHSSSRDYCATTLPVSSANLARGWIDESLNLWWPEDLAYPGCMNVHGLAEIDVTGP